MAAAVPGPSPFHHPPSRSVPGLTPVDDLDHRSPQENCTVDSSDSTVVSTPVSEDLRPPQPFSALNSNTISAFSGTHGEATSFFSGASNFQPGISDGWELLMRHTAPKALHNSSARYDAPKCDEDTRVEVINELMDRLQDRDSPQRLMCMTGAAGSGKSALQQSIAELCAEDNILGAAYFISAADRSRNTASTVVPTIAYQLGLNHPTLKPFIAAEVDQNPLIFDLSLKTQMDALIVRPFKSLQSSEEYDISTFPYAILIDGLDECQGEATGTTTDLGHAKTRAEERQAELLAAIKDSLLTHDLPFRIFIASRPEWAIRTALDPGGSLHDLAYHVQLSEYDATQDMRRYLQRRFHGLRSSQPRWFTEGDIDALVRAGSGQFVYVAIVFKYVSERRASPAQRLKTVLSLMPGEGQVKGPFEALDMLYTNILLSAKEAYEAVNAHSGHDFLLLFRMFHLQGRGPLYKSNTVPNRLLHLEDDALTRVTFDLRSLVYLEEDESGIVVLKEHHKSLSDFMDDETRAKDLCVPVSRVHAHLAKCLMEHILKYPNIRPLPDRLEDLSVSQQHLVTAITELHFLYGAVGIEPEIAEFTSKGYCHIFSNDWFLAWYSIDLLGVVIDKLEKHDPKAALMMSMYVEKWKEVTAEKKNECPGPDSDTDSGSDSDDEDECSDSD
ncbi:hypothetical protein EST38_g10293 [Candolleomyces aberdarensis]|uniref:Nephrocystin 3-like N-terminal domain-containing protein n=1 Tax=Candolleomyces aberdarensis TaxID=2316362 RepID=A0A4Q2D8F3_9AGAR|nr:hypothetical protein EST38_g10293 [Candolleomyces aberdarensis]